MSNKYEYNATITELIELHDELRIIRVSPDEPLADFQPGQYVEIGVNSDDPEVTKIIRRQYSIASAPNDPRGVELYIVLVDGGALTNPLWEIPLQGRLWLNPKVKGKFTLEEVAQDKNYIFVATGTGLAPFISMLRSYSDNPPWRKVVVVHGVRHEIDLGYRSELESLSRANSQLQYLPCVSRDQSFEGLQGRIPTLLADGSLEQALGWKLDPASDQVLMCGNPAMIEDLVNLLQLRGFLPHKRKAPGNIHFERYW